MPILEAQPHSVSTRLDLTITEQHSIDAPPSQGYQMHPCMVELRLGFVDLVGQLGQLQGQLVQGRAAISQARQKLSGVVSGRHADISKDM